MLSSADEALGVRRGRQFRPWGPAGCQGVRLLGGAYLVWLVTCRHATSYCDSAISALALCLSD